MNSEVKNNIIDRIKTLLICLQKGIYDIEAQNNNNKQMYQFDIFKFHTIKDLFKYMISDLDDGTLLYKVFNIESYESNDKVNLNTDDFDSPKDNPHIFTLASVELHETKLVSKVIRYRLYICTNTDEKNYLEDYDKVVNSYLEYLDSFNSKYFVKIDFDYYNDTIESELIFENLYVESEVFAIRENDTLPLWIEYIVNSFALYRAGNKEMAFFVAFASLDNFIEKLNNVCIEAYENIKIKEMNLKDFSTYNDKYVNFKNDNRRLIDEKLKAVLNEIYNEDVVINEIFSNLKKAEKKRNIIAHCNDKRQYEEGDYENLLINYLNLLYKLEFGERDSIFNLSNVI